MLFRFKPNRPVSLIKLTLVIKEIAPSKTHLIIFKQQEWKITRKTDGSTWLKISTA